MEDDIKNKKKSNSEMIPFDISNFSTLQYVKIIFVDKYNELCELRAENNIIKKDTIQLYINSQNNIDINCPIGVVLKLVTNDTIYFAKTILQYVKNSGDRFIFVLKTPPKTIRQQNRKYARINVNCPCVISYNDNKNNRQTYIAQSINISKGGALLSDIDSILLSYKPCELQLSEGDSCNIVIFLRHDSKIKTQAKFIRKECIDDVFRYAFQFTNMPDACIDTLDKYLTKAEFKLLKQMTNN